MKSNRITCPHCSHILTDDDMNRADYDLYAIAPNEEDGELPCPECGIEFYIRGSYIPVYETFKTEDDM